MSVLYVTESGAMVQRRAGRFIVSKEKRIIQEVPEVHVEQLILLGYVHVTPAVIAHCLEQGLDVAFLSGRGRYRGRLAGDLHKSAELRQRQYERAADSEFGLRQARAIVGGKLANMQALERRQEALPETVRYHNALANAIKKAPQARSNETLLGIEGNGTAAYFAMFGRWVPAPWTFTRRVSHPPDSAVNALLSLGYSLLYSRVIGVVNIVGLDPYLGCFHAPRHGHAALASDLMEEFRSLVVDALVLRLLRRRQLRPADIIETNQYGWRLQPESLKVFLTEFETRLQSRRQVPPDGDRLSYRQIIENQARHYARVLTGQDAVYRPFAAK